MKIINEILLIMIYSRLSVVFRLDLMHNPFEILFFFQLIQINDEIIHWHVSNREVGSRE
jgi:hypothetical protein